MVAGIDERDAQMLAGFPVGLGRNGNSAGSGNDFKADGDVDVVAEQFVLVGHHIAHVDAEPELHDPIGGEVVVSLRHQRLHLDGSLDCPDDAGKLQQETVAGVLHELAAMIEDDRVDRGSMRLERGVRTLLVGPHHSASSRRRLRRLWQPGVFPSRMCS